MLATCLLGLALAAGPARPERLAVIGFKVDGDAQAGAELGRLARQAAISVATGRADVIDPEMVALMMQKSSVKCTGDECDLELAGALGATLAVIGTVHSTQAGAVLEVKLFEDRGRRVRPLAAESATAPDPVQLLPTADALVRKVLGAGFARLDDEARARDRIAQAGDWEKRRGTLSRRRTFGWWTAGAGAVVGLAGGFFALQATKENDRLQTRLPTAADITRAQDARTRDQRLAVGAGAAGGALVLAGLGLVLFNGDPGEFRAAAAPIPGGAALALGGSFR